MPNVNIYLNESDYRYLDEVGKKTNKKTTAVGKELLESAIETERKLGLTP